MRQREPGSLLEVFARFIIKVRPHHAALPDGSGPLRAEEVGQQGRVQVQCLAASAGQQRRKMQRAAFNRVLNAVKVVLQLQRFCSRASSFFVTSACSALL